MLIMACYNFLNLMQIERFDRSVSLPEVSLIPHTIKFYILVLFI